MCTMLLGLERKLVMLSITRLSPSGVATLILGSWPKQGLVKV